MTKRLGAIGTLVWDRISNPFVADGAVREQWGGAVYSFAALSAACPPGWSIEPIVKIGRDFVERGRAHLSSLPGVTTGAGVVEIDAPNNRVELRYHDLDRRVEVQTGGVPSWHRDELAPLLDRVDALYVNFLSGNEMELETAQQVRADFAGPIYADLHSLFLGPPGSSEGRRARPLPRWREWLACFDAIQLNEDEVQLLAPENLDREAFVRDLPSYGPGLVLMTQGGRGVRYVSASGFPANPLLWRDATCRQGVCEATLPAPTGRLPGDPTGCGDVWGASFFAGLLGGLPLEDSIIRSQRMAAEKIAHPETAVLHQRLQRIVLG